MRESESVRRMKGRSHSIVGSDGPKVAGVEVIELSNKKVDVVRGERVVLLQIIERGYRPG